MESVPVILAYLKPNQILQIKKALDGSKYLPIAFKNGERTFPKLKYHPQLAIIGTDSIALKTSIRLPFRSALPYFYVVSDLNEAVLEQLKKQGPVGFLQADNQFKLLKHQLDLALMHKAPIIQKNHLPNLEEINNKLLRPLTKSEYKVMNALYKGYTNKQIAIEFHVSLNTVKTHIRHLYEKLAINSRWELMNYFRVNKYQHLKKAM